MLFFEFWSHEKFRDHEIESLLGISTSWKMKKIWSHEFDLMKKWISISWNLTSWSFPNNSHITLLNRNLFVFLSPYNTLNWYVIEIDLFFPTDPMTPGRREGLSYCMLAYNLYNDPQNSNFDRFVNLCLFLNCRLTVIVFHLTSTRSDFKAA